MSFEFNPERDISHLKETTVSQATLHKSVVVNFRHDQVLSPNGQPCVRDVVEHPGGVVVMPILDNGDFVMVEQWRYPLGKTLLEFPAGKLEARGKEDPFEAIQRELLEETGYKANTWEKLNYLYTAPGFCDEKLYLYKATGLTLVNETHVGDDDEFLDIHQVPANKAVELARQGHITDAKTLSLLFHHLAALQ